MATKLDKPIKRVIKVLGIDYPVYAWFSKDGIEMSLPGFKTRIWCDWYRVINSMRTPNNVASILEGEPHKFLLDQQSKLAKKAASKVK